MIRIEGGPDVALLQFECPDCGAVIELSGDGWVIEISHVKIRTICPCGGVVELDEGKALVTEVARSGDEEVMGDPNAPTWECWSDDLGDYVEEAMLVGADTAMEAAMVWASVSDERGESTIKGGDDVEVAVRSKAGVDLVFFVTHERGSYQASGVSSRRMGQE